jgi:glycosyltransferase involved in cell wall biosynthesis
LLRTDETPDVTVVIPTRNREEMLRRAVDSCFAAAGAEVCLEVIVAVDGCGPDYAAGLERADGSVRVLRSVERRGRGSARNRGLVAARGSYVKFLDDDDWLEPGALAAEVECAEATDADIVASGHRVRGKGVEEMVHWPPDFEEGVDSLLRGEAVPTAAALYRRRSIGDSRWDEEASKLDDWRFFVRVGLSSPRIRPLRVLSYTWFAHAGQGIRSSSLLDNAREFYDVLDEIESVLRQRGELTERRRLRLAQYRYKELRILCRFDPAAYREQVRKIRSLDPAFEPRDEERQWYMRWSGRVVGFDRAVRAHEWIRRQVHAVLPKVI